VFIFTYDWLWEREPYSFHPISCVDAHNYHKPFERKLLAFMSWVVKVVVFISWPIYNGSLNQIYYYVPFQFDHLNSTFSNIIFFCTFAGMNKQKISAYHVFRKYRLITIYSGTNLSRFLVSRLLLSITWPVTEIDWPSIFAVNPSAWFNGKKTTTFLFYFTQRKKLLVQ
jgi:hypothetical protein